MMDHAARFWARTEPAGDCLVWTGPRHPNGYGMTYGAPFGLPVHAWAHRAAYTIAVGPIPEGLTLDHLCRNKPCVNPAHLEPVTQRVNSLRSPLTHVSINLAKTHCPSGHPYDAANTYRSPGDPVRRKCRVCIRVSSQRFIARRAALKAAA